MTDPDTVQIEAFNVERQEMSGFAPVLTLYLQGRSKAASKIAVKAQYSVTGFNL